MKKCVVATHNGSFHADDVFSIATLKQVLPHFELIRTRDLAIIAKADIVIDVGGEYDAETGRFDHHQRGGAGARSNGTPYSSFGLIWQKYGLALCDDHQALADAVDRQLVATIDAVDCGYVKGVAEGISLSQTIAMFNPTWEEDSHFDACFNDAVEFAEQILKRFISAARGGIHAKSLVLEAIEKAEDSRLIVLDKYTPWKTTVFNACEQALYVVYPSETGQWRIQTVPAELGSFADRKPLPAAWAGLADEALQNVSGIDDAMFCHNGRFIAGCESLAGVMKMAQLALDA